MKVLFFIISNLVWISVFAISLQKSKQHKFYQDSWWLVPFGVYVWGDGLVLAPFWIVSTLLLFFVTPLNIFRYIVLFYSIRSFYEVMYWLTHQVSRRDYQPPLFRQVKWLEANEAAILYQLIHMCVVVLGIAVLFYSFL